MENTLESLDTYDLRHDNIIEPISETRNVSPVLKSPALLSSTLADTTENSISGLRNDVNLAKSSVPLSTTVSVNDDNLSQTNPAKSSAELTVSSPKEMESFPNQIPKKELSPTVSNVPAAPKLLPLSITIPNDRFKRMLCRLKNPLPTLLQPMSPPDLASLESLTPSKSKTIS